MAAKIRWFKRHHPETATCRTWHQPVSFVVEALCGHAIMDHALASTTMLYALDKRDYGADLLDEFEVDRRQLPDIGEASAPAGRLSMRGAALTGLPQGMPVAVGTGDDFANAIGAGVIAPGLVSCTIGTGEVNAAISTDFRIDPEGLVQTHGFAGGNYYVGNPGWLGGGAVTWFISTFGIDSPEEMSRLAGIAPAGSDGLNFLPALSGAMAPRWIASARGAFYGLTSAHGTAACARSVLEGCAFSMRDVLTRLDALGIATDRIRLSGGGAKSLVWARIRADVSQRPVEVPDITDMAPVGAALLATVAAGKFDTIQQAASAMPRKIETVDPDPSLLPAYDQAYQRYRKLFEALAPLYAEGG
jgi:xylulokinase